MGLLGMDLDSLEFVEFCITTTMPISAALCFGFKGVAEMYVQT